MKKIITAVLMSIMALSSIRPQHLDTYWIPSYYCGVTLNQDSINTYPINSYNGIGNDTLMGYTPTYLFRPNVYDPNIIYSENAHTIIQQFHTDTALQVKGIAVFIFQKMSIIDYPIETFDLRDSRLGVIDSVRWDTIPIICGIPVRGEWHEFMFSQERTIHPGNFGIGFNQYAYYDSTIANYCYPGIWVLNDYNGQCLSPLPLLGIWRDSILPVSSSPNPYYAKDYSTMFMFPILAWEDTNSSLEPNVMVERYSQIYPNPAQNNITVTCSFAMESIELYNPEGQRVLSRQANKAHTLAIDVSTLAKGVYLCKIKTAKGCASKKVMKKIITAVLMSIMALSAIGQQHLDKYWIPSYYCGVNLNQDSLNTYPINSYNGIGNDTLMGYTPTYLFRPNIYDPNIIYSENAHTIIQQFHTDTALQVKGIAVFIFQKMSIIDYPIETFDLRDSRLGVIDSVRWDTIPIICGIPVRGEWHEFMFSQERTIHTVNFGIGFNQYAYYDSTIANYCYPGIWVLNDYNGQCLSPLPLLGIWRDSILPVSSSPNPYYAKDYSTMFMFPILAWEDTSSSLKPNVMVERYSQIYPNPTQNNITVTCSFAMESIELYNPEGQREIGR